MGIPSQKLRGFVGQGMSGRRQNPAQVEPYSFPAAASAYSFTIPRSGKWKFVGWGPGGVGTAGAAGASGGYFEITRQLRKGVVVTITVGRAATSDTSVVLPDGTTATATRASSGTAGSATGGDVNLAGSAGSTAGTGVTGTAGLGTGGGAGGAGDSATVDGGSGAPANLPYRGGQGGAGNIATSTAGVGAGGALGSGTSRLYPGNGLVLAVVMRAA